MSYPKYLLVGCMGDWEALYVKGKSVWQGDNLDRFTFLDLAQEHGFTSETLLRTDLGSKDEAKSESTGQFPKSLMFMTDTVIPEDN